mgnify:CR=1 FL=1
MKKILVKYFRILGLNIFRAELSLLLRFVKFYKKIQKRLRIKMVHWFFLSILFNSIFGQTFARQPLQKSDYSLILICIKKIF